MFTPERREDVRHTLLERAAADPRVAGAAVTGSAAAGREDRWSDVDLFLGVADGVSVAEVLGDFTDAAYRELGALHHFDLHAGTAVYRAFLLGDLLEIDLGFAPAADFGPRGEGGFRVVFGEAAPRRASAPDPGHLIGLAWHHVIHARTAIERGTPWQAEHWIGAVRAHTLSLACLRLGLPAAYAKGADRLPAEVTAPLRETLVRDLDANELRRALRAATAALLRELRATDPALAETLAPALTAAVSPPETPASPPPAAPGSRRRR
ncbi:hypothetical protein [Streptomyces sp. 6N223]|uniref:hypothetical protein n=1 Tax=Streptomyces sp. 6N223 TaxID=3457412 RepID=UPI003FD0E886